MREKCVPVMLDKRRLIESIVMNMETKDIVTFISDLVSDKSFFTAGFPDTVIERIKEDHL